jgi:hypothetical protein
LEFDPFFSALRAANLSPEEDVVRSAGYLHLELGLALANLAGLIGECVDAEVRFIHWGLILFGSSRGPVGRGYVLCLMV